MAGLGDTSERRRHPAKDRPTDDGATADAYECTMYVTGSTATSNATIEHFRHFCEDRWANRYVLEVVDLHDDPAAAAERGVFVTPTLLVEIEGKTRKLVGDFGNATAVAQELGLSSAKP